MATTPYVHPVLHTIAHPKQAAFLAGYLDTGSVAEAARLSGVARRSHYHWIDTDPEYATIFDTVKTEVRERFESEAIRRAVDGVGTMIFCNGAPVVDPETGQPYIEVTYSDKLLMCLLKRAMPEKYGSI